MGIAKPYFRIIRPWKDGLYTSLRYETDRRYAEDRASLCRAFNLIVTDLIRILEFIEPVDQNLSVFSHRNYELLLRSATEFETNSKRILDANGYKKSGDLNITDYYKIEQASRLSEYEVILDFWQPQEKILMPFEEWSSGSHVLSWYQSYNQVKHDREVNFSKASFKNTLLAIAGLFVILFSQFGIHTFKSYQKAVSWEQHEDRSVSTGDDIFRVRIPQSWSVDERYDFNWDDLLKEKQPFQKFNFV